MKFWPRQRTENISHRSGRKPAHAGGAETQKYMKNNNKIVTEAEPKLLSRMDGVKLLHANACISTKCAHYFRQKNSFELATIYIIKLLLRLPSHLVSLMYQKTIVPRHRALTHQIAVDFNLSLYPILASEMSPCRDAKINLNFFDFPPCLHRK